MKAIKRDTKVEMRSFTRPATLKHAVYEDVDVHTPALVLVVSLFLPLSLSRYRYSRSDSSPVHESPCELRQSKSPRGINRTEVSFSRGRN